MKHLLIAILILSTVSAKAQKAVDSCQWYKRRCDTLSHQRYVEDKKYLILKRYVTIVIKSPKNAKYLKSWLRNADAQKE